MAENTESQELNVPADEPVVTEGQSQGTPQERQYSDAEQRAMAQGWVPEDQYSGTGKWRSAEDFLDRGEFFQKIDELNRRNRSVETALLETKQHLKRVRETEFKRALQTLKNEKKEALDVGDTERVVELDEEIAQTKNIAAHELRQMDAAPVQEAPPNPHFVQWVNQNGWYQSDRVMKAAADTIADELVYNGERNPTKVLAEVRKRIEKEFPHKFTNPNRSKPGTVEAGGRASSGSRSDSFQLTAEETQVMYKLVKHKVMTKEEYIADIKASRGVK